MNCIEKQARYTPARNFNLRFCLFVAVLLIQISFALNLHAQNAIVTENKLTGNLSSEWDISGAGDLSIQGFATDISVNKGETVHFKIKTNASAYSINIYRIGYYSGRGARKVGTATVTASLPQTQPADLTDKTTGLVDCGNWRESANWAVPATAVSGIYIAKLIRTDNGGASHIVFIVRDDASTSNLFFQTSDATWQAYNGYGGNSLYVNNSGTPVPGFDHATKVSYNRPFYTRNGNAGGGVAEDWLFNAEYPMIRWLERNGYDMSYTTDVDADRRGSLIRNHKIFLSVGHDEYWSAQQRANVEAARDAGVNLGFLSSNEIYWKTRWEPSIDGTNTTYRTLVCYKEGTLGLNTCGGKCDPLPNVWTGLWRDGCNYPSADGCRPENGTSGQISWLEVTGAITVPATFKGYRFWRNTSIATLNSGSTTLSNGTLGYEIDYEQDNGAYPAGRVVMSQTAIGGVTHKLSLYRAASGALVFGTGTGQWSWGLDGTHDRGSSVADSKVQQATVNVFADMGVQAGSLQTGLFASAASNDLQPPATVISSPRNNGVVTPNVRVTISGTATETPGIVAGVEVSVDGGATWLPATGTTSWSYNWTPTAVGNYTIKSRAVDDLGNLEKTATSSNTIQVSTNATNCTPPTATLNAAPANCQGNSIALKLTAATGTGPYTVVVNSQTYTNAIVGQNFATVSTDQSIWGSTGAPGNPNDNDGTPIEVGTKFRATQSGTIAGIRFYKGTSNSGTHTGNLWSATGTKLASIVFSNETASGWQEARFTTPVAISANTTYVASYFSTSGVYASTDAYFASASVTNGSLTALATGTDGANGVYKLTSTGFPTSSFNSSNYWVDVIYKPGSSYNFALTSITDANGCNNSGNISSSTVTQSDLQSATITYYQDNDGDGYGSGVTQTGCTAPAGYVTQGGDCDDSKAAVHPGATEICGNGIDDNCNGQIDENCTTNTYYRDADGDGYGNPSITAIGSTPPSGYVSNNTDCNDNSSSIHPGATEVCGNGIDDNCNGQIDENCTINTYYRDADGDSYGNPAITTTGSVPPAGYVSNNTDCNDNSSSIHPGATEICGNGIDENCNGMTDDVCPVVTEQSIWANTGIPQNPNDYDGTPIEVGVKFRASQGGTVTGIRFYKGSTNTGTHTGNLWTSAGVKLASATFVNETATGWQEVRFPAPGISISANTTYVASYFSTSGKYGSSEGFFTSGGVTNGSLTALRAGTDGPNGVYRLSTTGYPTLSYNSSNYWVDVVFKPASASRATLTSTGANPKLSVEVKPNPTASSFNLFTHGSNNSSIELRVIDGLGRIVEMKKGVTANSSVQIGQKYRPGSYYVQLIQGYQKVTVKVEKLSQ